jgi:hypothetical protein
MSVPAVSSTGATAFAAFALESCSGVVVLILFSVLQRQSGSARQGKAKLQ